MRTVYVIRRTKEWRDNFVPNQSYHTQRSVSLWNTTFDMGYSDFRRELNRIREDNYRHLRFDERQELYAANAEADGLLLFPTDDDDWFHHDVTEIVLSTVKDHQVCCWDYVRMSVDGFDAVKDDPMFGSNGYAVKTPVETRIINSHMFAAEQLTQPVRETRLLSLYNFNLSSLSFLKKMETRMDLIDKFSLALEPKTFGPEIPQCFSRYIDQMVELYKKVQPKRTLKLL